jgi:CRP-like cAMP-binding protein
VPQASFKPEEVVFEQGDKGTVFYVVLEGTASVLINEAEVAKITAGDFFGERALLKDEPRAATIKATSVFETMSISREKFEAILGPLSQYLEARTPK